MNRKMDDIGNVVVVIFSITVIVGIIVDSFYPFLR